jgi:hypothetical protein
MQAIASGHAALTSKTATQSNFDHVLSTLEQLLSRSAHTNTVRLIPPALQASLTRATDFNNFRPVSVTVAIIGDTLSSGQYF